MVDHTFQTHGPGTLPSCHCYSWHHPLHGPCGRRGCYTVEPSEALRVALSPNLIPWLSSHAGRAAGLLRGVLPERPRVRNIHLAGAERCGGGVRNTAHAELTLTAAGTVLPLSGVQQVVYTPARCLAELREASASTRG